MKIDRWENWYTYSSFYFLPDLDLDRAAHQVVSDGLADFASHRDGLTIWKEPNGIGKGHLSVDIDSRMHAARMQLSPTNGESTLTKYQMDCLGLVGQFRYSEARLFGLSGSLPHAYLRCFLGKFRLSNESTRARLSLYPILTLYDTGVVLLHLRVFSPQEPLDHRELVDSYLNLCRDPYHLLEGPPAFGPSGQIARLDVDGLNLGRRAMTLLPQVRDLLMKEDVEFEKENDFTFSMALLAQDEAGSLTTLSLANAVFSAFGHSLSDPHTGWRFVLKGSKGRADWGTHWRGRPNLHVLDFEGQKELASEQLEAYAQEWKAILFHSNELREMGDTRKELRDLRLFNDYNCFVTVGGSLWIWAGMGIRRHEEHPLPSGSIAVEPQVVVEAIEYGYMLYRLLLHLSGQETMSGRLAVDLQAGALRLQGDLERAATSGEIRDLIRHAWSEMGLDDIRRELAGTLELRRERFALDEYQSRESTNRWLTILFGILAVPSISELVLKPIWGYWELPRPDSDDAHLLLLVSFSVVIVSLLIAFVLWWNRDR